MRKVQIILGPPGTGKTTTLLNIVEEALARGIPPERIAYLAFTRKAAYEAQERAMAQFGFDESRFPYFRTLHSLAFRELGMQRDEVMTDSHYRKFGKAMGIEFKGIYDENIGLHTGDGLGDKCSRIESLARMGLRSIDEQMSITNVNDLNAHAVKQYHSALLAYKKDNGVYDFTDMLEKYNSELPVDICIFDEAQDLSSAQYKMAITAASLAGEVYIAGDDDQAILLQKINRYSKKWEPRKQEGDVVYVTNEQEIDFSNPGTWMLLSRSKYLLYRLKQAVRQQGYAYTINNRSSLESEETRAIIAWEAIRKGKRISQHEAKNLINFFGFTVNLLKQDNYGVEDLGLPDAARQYDWMTMLKGIAPDEREYLRSCMRNGEKFSDKPRITISTIHQSKD